MKRKRWGEGLLRLFIVLIATFNILWANDACLADGCDHQPIETIGVFKDVTGFLSYEEVKNRAFMPLRESVANFGFTSSIYWFKLSLTPQKRTLERKWWLRIDHPLLDYIDVYIEDSTGRLVKHSVSGELEPLKNRELLQSNFLFHVPVMTADPFTLYVRVQTDSAMLVPLELLSSESLIEEQESTLLWMGLYYGIFIIIVFYNVVLYFQIKEKNYLVYLLFVGSLIMWQLSIDGIGVAYFWPDFVWMIEHGPPLWITMAAFFALLFGRNFLQTNEHLPRMDNILLNVIIFTALSVIAALFAPYKYVIPIAAALGVIVPLVLLISGLLMLKKSYRPVKFFIAGWSAFLIGSMLFALNKFNIIPGYLLIKNAQQIGSALEMILLSWALTDRVRLYKDEYIRKVDSLNSTLKDSVEKEVHEVHEKEKLLLQQSRLAAMGEMIEQIAHQWRQPLNTLALINNDLYIKMKLGTFNEKIFEKAHVHINDNLQYMSKTIDDFRNYYQSDREAERFELEALIKTAFTLNEATMNYAKISCVLESEKSHYVSAIKNELLQVFMNLLKNSHDAIMERKIKEPYVKVTMNDEDLNISITIEDNAGGIDKTIMKRIFDPYFTTKRGTNGTGIGLFMSKTIIEERLQGTMSVENSDVGARFVIVLPLARVQRGAGWDNSTHSH